MQRRTLLSAASAALALTATGARAQQRDRYPSRPITILVGFAPGGAGDVTARFIADAAKEKLGVPVVVENRPGAGATLAAAQLARSQPDGYTFALATTSPFTVSPHLQTVQYDAAKDFTYLVQYLVTPHPAYVTTQSPFRTWQDVIAYARANPGRLRWATAAPRGGPHIATEAAFRKEGVRTTFVPFGGGSEAIAALLGGHIEMVVSADYPPLLEAGQVRVLAEIGPDKVPGMENVPTFVDLGYPLPLQMFFGLAGPAGLPAEVIGIWERVVQEIMATPAWADLMQRYKATSSFLPHARFQERVLFTNREIGRLVRELGFRS
ncbi:MAG: tripartite tricarboxylate transporter substrate binding protein [Acetobacteraceae bacterium]|nr:tripartite tricarboxylate transporter substrate binding protein [Acetobacteraceae bacterium]